MKNSVRKFQVAYTSNRQILLEVFSLSQLLSDDCNCELRYSIQERGVDVILDLHINDSLITEFRDSEDTILILRIQ